MKFILTGALLAVSLFAVGCSGEPSEVDIKAAFEKDMAKTAQTLDDAGKMFGGVGKALTDSRARRNCTPSRKSAARRPKTPPVLFVTSKSI